MEASVSMIWNAVLSLACGSFVWWVRGVNVKIDDNRKLLSRTREDMAREYALKSDVERDLKQIMDRFDRLEIKLDNLMERIVK
mgnify:FL=1